MRKPIAPKQDANMPAVPEQPNTQLYISSSVVTSLQTENSTATIKMKMKIVSGKS